MKKSDFLSKFSELLENKDILEKLLLIHNCGIIEINTNESVVSLSFFKNHYYFNTNIITYTYNEFLNYLSNEDSDKLKNVLEKFDKEQKIVPDKMEIRIPKTDDKFISFYFHFNTNEGETLRGVVIENPNFNPFNSDLLGYNDFLEYALSTSKIYIWKWDFRNKKQIFNKEYYEFLGYDPNEIQLDFDKQKELVHPDDFIKVEKQLNAHFSEEKDYYELEFRMKRKDGSWQWLISKGKIVKVDINNVPLEIVGVHIDISELKALKSENELTKVNFFNLIDLAEDIICIKDGEGRWLLANAADIKLFGLENVDYYGKTDQELSYFTSKIYKDAFRTCVITDEIAWKNGGLSRSDEKIPIDDKGNVRIFDVLKKPVFDEDGSRRALLVIGRDVTEKRNIEQIERKLATQNRIIREFAVMLLNQKTIDNVIELLTKYLSEINNNIVVISSILSNSNILKISSIYPSTFLRTVIKHFPNVLERIAIKLSDEYIDSSKDKFKHFGVVHTNLYDASLQKLPKYIAKSIQEIFGIQKIETIGIIFDDYCYGYISFFLQENDSIEDKDIIESMVYLAAQAINRLNIQEALENAKKTYEISNFSKDKFFSVLAHDLEQPIQNLLNFSETLSKNFSSIPVAELKKLLNELRDNISYTNYILENLFEWSKIEMNKIEFMPKPSSVFRFYVENESLILTGASKKNITFVNLLNQDHTVEVDINLISMVFRNIINNAIKFTPKKGKIEIESFDVGNFIRIDVRDNGVGIDREDLPKLFRKDIKFSTLGTEGEEGSGLGLIVAQSYIQMHGGELHIDSAKDKGTIVFFTLPKQV